MKDGANVPDACVAFFESPRTCLVMPLDEPAPWPEEVLDWVRVCVAVVGAFVRGDGEEKMADFGRELLTGAGAGTGDEFRAKGLLRRCAVPLPENDMAETRHQQQQWRDCDNMMLVLSRAPNAYKQKEIVQESRRKRMTRVAQTRREEAIKTSMSSLGSPVGGYGE